MASSTSSPAKESANEDAKEKETANATEDTNAKEPASEDKDATGTASATEDETEKGTSSAIDNTNVNISNSSRRSSSSSNHAKGSGTTESEETAFTTMEWVSSSIKSNSSASTTSTPILTTPTTSTPPPLTYSTSLPKHLSDTVTSSFLDPDLDVHERLDRAQKIRPFLEEIDGYWSFSSNIIKTGNSARSNSKNTEGQLPHLEWNAHFRKSYTLLLWVRPRIGAVMEPTTIAEDDANANVSNSNRLLYRFGTTDEDDISATGVAVSVGEWRAIEDDDDYDGDDDYCDDNQLGGNNNNSNINSKHKHKHQRTNQQTPRKLITTLTAYSLPHEAAAMEMAMASTDINTTAISNTFDPAPFVTAPLELVENEWSMIGITHVFPYLKRPHWTICVNGKTLAGGELAYPQFITEKLSSRQQRKQQRQQQQNEQEQTQSQTYNDGVMQFNTLFRNICKGGCEILRTSGSKDCFKKASDLQQTALNGSNPRHHLRLHLSTFLLASEVFSPTIQALLAQAGPTMALQSHGNLPRMPPVANWSKGSSLEGVNVGIPLVVHGQSLRVQQLGASCVLWGSAVESKVVVRLVTVGLDAERQQEHYQQHGYSNNNYSIAQQRIVCWMPLQRGTTHSAPRVGLIQPTPPLVAGATDGYDYHDIDHDSNEEGPISMVIVGSNCSIHHNLSDYLISNNVVFKKYNSNNDVDDGNSSSNNNNSAVDTFESFQSTSKLFSMLILQGQALDCATTLPFFLSLPPPGTRLNLQLEAVTQSLQHLFALFSHGARYAACLIHTLAASLRTGGGRWHEEILQNGTIHVLASALRQSLVRAEFLGVDEFSSYGDLVKGQAAMNMNANTNTSRMTTTMDQLPVTPTKIPRLVVEAVLDLLDACFGPPSDFVEDLVPSMQIQRTSDLALTALFGLALDWDLWGNNLEASARVLKAVSERYGGVCVTWGHIVRSQISVQFFLDTLKYKLHNHSNNNYNNSNERCLRSIGRSCGDILKAMLLSSLSNARSISQGEHDISACMGALSECSLGSVCAHGIFRAIVGILEWCEIVPADFVETSSTSNVGGGGGGGDDDYDREEGNTTKRNRRNSGGGPRIDDDHKCQVASRLARNLIISQFHDVIAPMLLSRTVFSAERTTLLPSSSSGNINNNSNNCSDKTSANRSSHRRTASTGTAAGGGSSSSNGESLPLLWQENWRLCLMIFAWISSIAGPEGSTASKSLGSLLLASGLAGSLEGVLEHAGNTYSGNLFLPDPTMAMTVASTLRSDGWSYSDLLSDRLAIMMPIFPSLVVSLVSTAGFASAQDNSKNTVAVPSKKITPGTDRARHSDGRFVLPCFRWIDSLGWIRSKQQPH